MSQFGHFPVIDQKPDLSVPVGELEKFKPPPKPTFDAVKYASDAAQPQLPPYIIGSSAQTNTNNFPGGYKMSGKQVALCLAEHAAFEGEDLIWMTGVWNRETIGGSDGGAYPHQIVWRPSTMDYSFGGGGFNMMNQLGPDRRAVLTKIMGRPIHNVDLLDPIVMAKACRWLFDIGLNGPYHNGLQHWGGYKAGHTGREGINYDLAKKVVTASLTPAQVIVPFSEIALYFQKAMNYLGYTDDRNEPLVEDGKYGRRSKATCIKFQDDHELLALGIVNRQTWDAIDLAVLRKGYIA